VASILNFHRPANVAVDVDGVTDASVVFRMIRDVQRVFRHLVGAWRVTLRASARGCWRLELAGASGRHVWIFAAPTAALSAVVVEKVERFLRDSAPVWRTLPT